MKWRKWNQRRSRSRSRSSGRGGINATFEEEQLQKERVGQDPLKRRLRKENDWAESEEDQQSNSDGTQAEEVNCWFCNKNWNVEAKNRNSWWCPGCEQYNGFTMEGDYNQDLSAHFHLMEGKTNAVTSPSGWDSAKSVLCSSCSQNQVIKVRQLAAFIPFCEADYEEEVSKYKSYLESVYELCSSCQQRVNDYLRNQDESLLKKMEKAQVKLKTVDKSSDKNGNGRSRMESPYPSERTPRWLRLFFFLCFVLASFQMFLGLMSTSSSKPHILTRIQKVLAPYLPKVVLDKGQWSAFAGACLCAVGLYCSGKYSIYPEDAVHLLSWLLLVLAHSEVFTAQFPGFQGNAPLMIAISTVSVIAAAACYFRERYPRHFCALSLNKKPIQCVNRTSHCDTAKRHDGKAVKKKTKSFDERRPIVSPSHAPASFSLCLQARVDQPVVEDMTQDLETCSLGLVRKSGSSSSIWSLPAIITSRPESPVDVTSWAPDSSSSSLNTSWPGHGHDPRSVLSPSRLGFLTFSSPSPSPVLSGSSRSPSPTSPWSSSCGPAFFSPISRSPSPSLSSTHSSMLRSAHQGLMNLVVQPSFASKFTNIEPEAESSLGPCDSQTHELPESGLRSKSSFTDYQHRQDGRWGADTMEKFHSIADNQKYKNNVNSVDKSAPRRSARLASSKLIHKPWPLKRSLSCNNMFDRYNSDSAGAKSRIDIASNHSAFRHTPTMRNTLAQEKFENYLPILPENMPSERCHSNAVSGIKNSVVGKTERCMSSKDHKRLSKSSGGWKNSYQWRDELSDKEEDEVEDRAVYDKEKWARRREYVKDTSWKWVCVGVLIGVSVTTNLFLLFQARHSNKEVAT